MTGGKVVATCYLGRSRIDILLIRSQRKLRLRDTLGFTNNTEIGPNAGFDLTYLEAELARHGLPTLADRLGGPDKITPIIDPQILDRAADPYRPGKRTVTALCDHYGITLDAAHTADADALAACRLTWVLLHRYWDAGAPQRRGHGQALRSVTPAGLHASQVFWKAEQADGLREFWRRKGDERWTEVQSEWPLLPTREQVPA